MWETPEVPGAPAGRPTGMWETPEVPGAPAGRRTGMSEVPVGRHTVHPWTSPEIAPAFPTHMDVGSARGRRERRRAGIPSIHGHSRKLLLHFRPTWMWEVPAGAGSAGGPAYRPSMDTAGNCSCISGIPSIHGHKKSPSRLLATGHPAPHLVFAQAIDTRFARICHGAAQQTFARPRFGAQGPVLPEYAGSIT